MKKITTKISVMLVDDDAEDRALFASSLSEILADYTLMTFQSSVEAIDYLQHGGRREKNPDILFLDINMPIIDGFETLEILRRHKGLQDLTIAIYSSSSLETDIHNALISGANIYITKPDSFEKLGEVLDRVFRIRLQNDGGMSMDNFLLSL